jgi:hypothetical protein
MLTLDGAGTLKFITGAATNLTGAMTIERNGGFVIPPNALFPFVETAINEALSIVTTSAVTNGVVIYITEP